jgi:hypothetical protein
MDPYNMDRYGLTQRKRTKVDPSAYKISTLKSRRKLILSILFIHPYQNFIDSLQEVRRRQVVRLSEHL